MSNGVVNLRRFRKAKERAERRGDADANAASHGESREAKTLRRAEEERRRRELDGAKRDGEG